MKPRYLTKSRFKLALECPTKLYYEGKACNGKKEYANQKLEDSFLQALADGGYQVGELAKQYYPEGHCVETLDYAEALKQTNELLQQEQVTIFEAALQFENLFVRVDILVKNKEHIELIEVKAKSFDPKESFVSKKGTPNSTWKSYLYDIAFQKYVASQALAGKLISASLMLADKTACCPSDGLNQKFRLVRGDNGRKKVVVSQPLTTKEISERILVKANVDAICEKIYAESISFGTEELGFSAYIKRLADSCASMEKIISSPTKTCKNCEYRASDEEKLAGLKDGFQECWQQTLGWTEADFKEPTIFDIWNYRATDNLMQEGRIKLSEVVKEDISFKTPRNGERQWLQIQKAQNQDQTYWIDKENLRCEMQSWVFPLHFIDFETAALAIPFNKGRHPYEGIAFQFSHHVVHENGKVEHRGQYLNSNPGVFPNYEFLRNLKAQLEVDKGSIFRYAAHENTYLNMIYTQLQEDRNEISDREELCAFIHTIAHPTEKSPVQWSAGSRNMIDLQKLVLAYYYDPAMKGSNSIKAVLPAVLNSSKFLQEKYKEPIYGATGGIKSLNYQDWAWLQIKNDQVLDPYKLLPKMFQDVAVADMEKLLSESEELKDGGAAMTAYARLQFVEMSDYEREEIQKALLKYCELDTLAMVMIYEAWKDMI